MLLNDKNIRIALRNHLYNRKYPPIHLLEEVRIHNGNAIADLVAINKRTHCYEIKGETDKISRLTFQGIYYNSTFNKITLVTTRNHLKKATKEIPLYWGILIIEGENDKIKFSYHRKTRNNPYLIKDKILLSLWKEELQFIYKYIENKNPRKSKNREELIKDISTGISVTKINEFFINFISNRKYYKIEKI
jgi:hypothetical protein